MNHEKIENLVTSEITVQRRWYYKLLVKLLSKLPISALMHGISGRTDMYLLVALDDEVLGEQKGGANDGATAHQMCGHCHWAGTTPQIMSALQQIAQEVMALETAHGTPSTVDEITGETWR